MRRAIRSEAGGVIPTAGRAKSVELLHLPKHAILKWKFVVAQLV